MVGLRSSGDGVGSALGRSLELKIGDKGFTSRERNDDLVRGERGDERLGKNLVGRDAGILGGKRAVEGERDDGDGEEKGN